MGAITGDYLGAKLWGSIPPIPTKNQTVVGWSPGSILVVSSWVVVVVVRVLGAHDAISIIRNS